MIPKAYALGRDHALAEFLPGQAFKGGVKSIAIPKAYALGTMPAHDMSLCVKKQVQNSVP